MSRHKRLQISIIAFVLAVILSAIYNIDVQDKLLSGLTISTTAGRYIRDDGTIFDLRDDQEGTMWLRKISPEGELQQHVALPLSKGSAGYRWEIIDVIGDVVYASVFIYESTSYEVLEQSLKGYDMTRGTCVYDYIIPLPAHATSTRFKSVRLWNGEYTLGYLYEGGQGKGDILELNRLNITSGRLEAYMQVDVPFSLTYIYVAEDGTLLAASTDSNIWLYDEGWRIIFSPQGLEAFCSISIGADGGMYIYLNGGETGDQIFWKPTDSNQFTQMDTPVEDIMCISYANEATWTSLNRNAKSHEFYFTVSVDGEVNSFEKLDVPLYLLWNNNTFFGILKQAGVAALIIVLAHYMLKPGKKRLIVKLIIIALPIFVLIMYLVYTLVFAQMLGSFFSQTYDELLLDASQAAESIDTAKFSQIDWEAPFADDYYLQLLEDFDEYSTSSIIPWNNTDDMVSGESTFYIAHSLLRADGDKVYIAYDDGVYVNLQAHFIDFAQRYELIDVLLSDHVAVKGMTYDYDSGGANAEWLTVFYPVFCGEELVAIVEVGRSYTDISSAVESIFINVLLVMSILFLMSLILYIGVLRYILARLGRLKGGAQELSEGNYHARVNIPSDDEIGDIATAFNSMAASIEEAAIHIRAVSDGYSHFVPREMLSNLGKDSIVQVMPGDYANLDGTYLLLSTDSFDLYREQAFFEALNKFYACVIPYISDAGGVIERYSGRGLSALFNDTPELALNALIDMYEGIDLLNTQLENNNLGEVECRVLLTYSNSLLGIIGDNSRLNMIAVSRLAYESEKVGKMMGLYGCRVVLAQSAYEELGNAAREYRHRLLGYISDNGVRRPIYDFYDSERPGLMRLKDDTCHDFQQAVALYYQGDYIAARRLLIDIIKKSPEDLAAREYLKESHTRLESGKAPGMLLEI